MNEGTAERPKTGAGYAMTELARLADELVEEIGAARRHYDDLRGALEGVTPTEVRERVGEPSSEPKPTNGSEPSSEQRPNGSEPSSEQRPNGSEPSSEQRPNGPQPSPPEQRSNGPQPSAEQRSDEPTPIDEARLAALNLVLMGADRDEARSHMCAVSGIEPTTADEILDQAFGRHFANASSQPKPKRRFRRRGRKTRA